jgi:tetratricopeptide (TPR) repeat protein
MIGLSTREVADIIGVPESRVRYWAQIGLVGPTYRDVEHGVPSPRPSYAFSDLVAARATRELTERGIPARRVREAIAALRAQLPSLDRPILHLRVLSDGDRLVVVGDQPYEPLTGQRVMDFQLDELSQKLQRLQAVPRATSPDLTSRNDAPTQREGSGPVRTPSALQHFERGLEHARAGGWPAAIEAYRAALALDPTLGAAHANLGALLGEMGALDEAEAALDQALLHDPGCVEARCNRAALHERRGEHARALALWAEVLPLAPARPVAKAGANRAIRALRARKAL